MELASALGLGFAHACRPFHRSLREPRQADSVLAVKEKLASQHSVAEAALQKLLFSGRVLADSVTLGEAGIKQGDFLVLGPDREEKIRSMKRLRERLGV